MAVLGIQFVITLMMATILSRVGPHLSLARLVVQVSLAFWLLLLSLLNNDCSPKTSPVDLNRWLLTGRLAGLVRYLHPSDEELRQFAPAPRYQTRYIHVLTVILCHRVDKKMVKKARQQEKQGTAPNSQTFQVRLVKFFSGSRSSWECKYLAVFLTSNNLGAKKCWVDITNSPCWAHRPCPTEVPWPEWLDSRWHFCTVLCDQVLHGVPVAAGLLLLLPLHVHPQRALHLGPAC